MTYDLGDAVTLTATARDASDNPVDATSAVLTITLPDGSTASPEVANPPTDTGAYSVAYTTTQSGLHHVRWVFTGPSSAHTDVFDVRENISQQLVSLADAKTLLRKDGSADDETLRGVIEAATGIIEAKIGPVIRRTYRERYRGAPSIALRRRQVLEVTEVAYVIDDSAAFDISDTTLDTPAGVLTSKWGWLPEMDLWISYTVGRSEIPPAVREAALIIVEHLWKTRRGQSARPGMYGLDPSQPAIREEAVAYYAGYALPSRAAELLAPYESAGGIA